MPRASGLSHAGGHNLMNAGAPDLPLEPRRRETSEEHQARMDAKRATARRFEVLDRAAAAPSTKSNALDRAAAIDAYRAGEGIDPIARRHHIGPATLQTWLREAGVPVRDAAAAREIRKARTDAAAEPTPAPVEQPAAPEAAPRPRAVPRPPATARTPTTEERARLAAVTAYVQGEDVPAIAARCGRSESTVYRWLSDARVQMRSPGPTAPRLDVPALAARYAEGVSLTVLARDAGANVKTVTRALREHGVQIRNGRARPAAPDPAPALPPAAPSVPAPLSTPPPADPDAPPTAQPVEAPAAARGHDPADELVLLRDALTARTPASTPAAREAVDGVRTAVQGVLDATDELRERWTDLQIARDLDAAGAFGRIRVAAEQVLALLNHPTPERTAS